MPHKNHFVISLPSHHTQSGIDVGKIFFHILYLETILSVEKRTPILAEVDGIKTIPMSHYAVAQFALKEIIVIAMHIKHSLAGCRIVLLLDNRRHHFAPVVIGHRYCFGNIPVAKHILLPICSTNRHKGCRNSHQ